MSSTLARAADNRASSSGRVTLNTLEKRSSVFGPVVLPERRRTDPLVTPEGDQLSVVELELDAGASERQL